MRRGRSARGCDGAADEFSGGLRVSMGQSQGVDDGAALAYSAGAGGALMVALIFTLVNLPSVAIWAAMGQGLRAC